MTKEDFFSNLHLKGATCYPKCDIKTIMQTNNILQQYKHAMLPTFLIDLYGATSCIQLGSGYIFGPVEITNSTNQIPSIITINNFINKHKPLIGKTIFARNDLFLFSFDTFGKCFMLNNLNLSVLRVYDSPYKAMYECLIAGKI